MRNLSRLYYGGSVKLRPLYTAIGIGSLMSSPESQLDYLAEQVGVPRAQVEKAIASQIAFRVR